MHYAQNAVGVLYGDFTLIDVDGLDIFSYKSGTHMLDVNTTTTLQFCPMTFPVQAFSQRGGLDTLLLILDTLISVFVEYSAMG